MMQQARENTGGLPREMSADVGYFSSDEVIKLTARGIDVYMPLDKMHHGYKDKDTIPTALQGPILRKLSVAGRMRRKLKMKKGKERYKLRKELPEPVFGQIKQAPGFRQFLLWRREKVHGEWRLICTGHNILKLFGACSASLPGQEFRAHPPLV